MKPKRNLTLFFSSLMLLLLAGCSSHDVAEYQKQSPRFDLFSFFEEKSWGRGNVLFNRAVMRKFAFRIGEVFIVFSKGPSFGKNGIP